MILPRDDAGKLDPQGCGSLIQFTDSVVMPARPSDANRKNYRIALGHLAKFLGHPPAVDELTTDNLRGTVSRLVGAGKSRETVQQVRVILLAIARQTIEHELLVEMPAIPLSDLESTALRPARMSPTPWPIGELDELLGSARTLPGDVAGIPSRRWWPALLMTLLDTALSVTELLAAPRTAYDPRTGVLSVGLLRYRLHVLAVEALNAILPHPHERLLPWPLDNGRSPFYILLRRMKHLLFRANLPHVTTNLFERLRVTARASSSILDKIHLDRPFTPRLGKPYLPRALHRRRWERSQSEAACPRREPRTQINSNRPKGEKLSAPRRLLLQGSKVDQSSDLIRITIDTPCNLLRFLNESYAPQRLADSSPDTVNMYRRTVLLFSWFLACDATFENLNEDAVDRFLAWLKQSGGWANATINGYRAELLAIWRHAWRKRKVSELPRDISKLSLPKRVPDAWSTAQVGLILNSAREEQGDICGIPACDWWPALILTLYDTGLRIAALMQSRLTDFDPATRWLMIPAEVQKQDADQVFRLPDDTVAAIVAMNERESNREWLFPWPLDPSGQYSALRNSYRRILKRAELGISRRDLFHKMRRTSATAVWKVMGKQAAQDHLGHSSASVTAGYLDPRQLVAEQSPSERIARPQGLARVSAGIVNSDDAAWSESSS